VLASVASRLLLLLLLLLLARSTQRDTCLLTHPMSDDFLLCQSKSVYRSHGRTLQLK